MRPLLWSRLGFLIQYQSAGAAGTIVSVITVVVAAQLLPLGLASAIGMMTGGQITFYVHCRWAFRARRTNRQWWHQWLLFTVGNVFCAMVINRSLVWIFLEQLIVNGAPLSASGTGKVIAVLLACLLTWPINLLFNNYIVFLHDGDPDFNNRREE